MLHEISNDLVGRRKQFAFSSSLFSGKYDAANDACEEVPLSESRTAQHVPTTAGRPALRVAASGCADEITERDTTHRIRPRYRSVMLITPTLPSQPNLTSSRAGLTFYSVLLYDFGERDHCFIPVSHTPQTILSTPTDHLVPTSTGQEVFRRSIFRFLHTFEQRPTTSRRKLDFRHRHSPFHQDADIILQSRCRQTVFFETLTGFDTLSSSSLLL